MQYEPTHCNCNKKQPSHSSAADLNPGIEIQIPDESGDHLEIEDVGRVVLVEDSESGI